MSQFKQTILGSTRTTISSSPAFVPPGHSKTKANNVWQPRIKNDQMWLQLLWRDKRRGRGNHSQNQCIEAQRKPKRVLPA